jgi:four helix bundle protein
MAQIKSHRDLLVWQKGMDLVTAIYALTKQFPVEERYGLIQQATRASVGVPANLAEGHSRGTRRDYAHYVSIARGSLMELETYVMIAERLGFTERTAAASVLEQITELGRMLTTLRQRLVEP